MVAGEGSSELTDDKSSQNHTNDSTKKKQQHEQSSSTATKTDNEGNEEEGEEDEDEDDEEEEPRLKYAPLTRSLNSVYRNGDASSSFTVSGDKMVIGTHNGNIHVLSMPSLQPLTLYRAHKASVTSISVSPNLSLLPALAKLDAVQRVATETPSKPMRSPTSSPNAKGGVRPPPVPRIPANEIYIATSSMDGHVCIQSLIDSRDVQLRDFGRPIQTVALSPEYKSDKGYLSGGQAGSLVYTVGGQAGRSTSATTTGAAAAASGWLGSIGLGANTGSDKVLHSGEGIISTIKWSLSGKYVLWVNEHGIKIMRSNLKLEASEKGLEWKRIAHINRPERWEEMAGVWKARADWFDRNYLDTDGPPSSSEAVPENGNTKGSVSFQQNDAREEVVVGWGDTVWIIRVSSDTAAVTKEASDTDIGRAEVATIIRLSDCVISGVSLYTPTLLLVLAHMESKDDKGSKKSSDGARNPRQVRHNALKPELRLVNINTSEEVEADSLSISRFQALSSADYHLGVLPLLRIPAQLAQKGYLGAIGSGMATVGSGMATVGTGIFQGVETVGQGMIDVTLYGPKMLGANRLFGNLETGSIRSGKVGNDRPMSVRGGSYLGWIPGLGSNMGAPTEEANTIATTQGMKIFICSPFDCIIAVKRSLADRMQWLEKMERYEQAWELLNEHPEAAGISSERSSEPSAPTTPSKASSLAQSGSTAAPAVARPRPQTTLVDFFADSASVMGSPSPEKNRFSSAEKEKRRIGELWLQQLVKKKEWREAGEVTERVLNTTSRWEHWVWTFLENKKFDEIAMHVPTMELIPPLPSSVFEMILGHYATANTSRFKELIDLWPSDLFEVSSITAAVEDRLGSREVAEDSKDWRNLQECLAKLYLADGHYKEALRCYVHLQDADTAMSLVKDHHLIEAIADDVPSFVLLRIPRSQLKTASREDLEGLSAEPIRLLVDEASRGVVGTEDVVQQLEDAKLRLFLFFYLRALWRGEGTEQQRSKPGIRQQASTNLAADEGKMLVEQYPDTAVEVFAQYDRELLMDFLQTATAYTFDKALAVCEKKKYIEEEVYLLSKTGAMRKALFLIIDELRDVSKAINFAKEQDDSGLWEDLLEYSMSRPQFISGLLSEVGTAIDPIKLVKRIPSGVEIEGLKSGLKKMIREHDLQDSISYGAAKVLSSEVAVGAETLRRGRRQGIRFDINAHARKAEKKAHETIGTKEEPFAVPVTRTEAGRDQHFAPGHCAGCHQAFKTEESETLIGFACGHIYHVTHLFNEPGETQKTEISLPKTRPQNKDKSGQGPSEEEDDDDATMGFSRNVGPKVTNARLLKDQVEAIGGCKACRIKREKDAEGSGYG